MDGREQKINRIRMRREEVVAAQCLQCKAAVAACILYKAASPLQLLNNYWEHISCLIPASNDRKVYIGLDLYLPVLICRSQRELGCKVIH